MLTREEAIKEIAKTLNHWPEVANPIDYYFSAYINMCRVFGSYDAPGMDMWRDPFFHGYSRLNLFDTFDDNGKVSNVETVITKFCPTNNSRGVGINLHRGDGTVAELDPFAKEYYSGYDKNKSSLDLEIALSTKMRGALDPHSETALYGSLVDFSNHCPIG